MAASVSDTSACRPTSEGEVNNPTKRRKRLSKDEEENQNSKQISRKTLWTTQEDILLLHYINKTGHSDIHWKEVAEYMAANAAERGVSSCRNRYYRTLKQVQVTHSVTKRIAAGNKESIEIKQVVSTGIQTEVSFTPRATVTWTSTLLCGPDGANSEGGVQPLLNESYSTLTSLLTHNAREDLHKSGHKATTALSTQSTSGQDNWTPKADSARTSNKSYKPENAKSCTGAYALLGGTSACSQRFPRSSLSLSNSTLHPNSSPVNKNSRVIIQAKRKITSGKLLDTSSSILTTETPSNQSSVLVNANSHTNVQPLSKTRSEHNYCKISTDKGARCKKNKIKGKASDQPHKVIKKKQEIPQRLNPIIRLWMDGKLTVSDIVNHLMANPIMKEALVDCLARHLGQHPNKLFNRTHGKLSVLMKKDYEHMAKTTISDITAELKKEFPELYKILVHMMHANTEVTGEQLKSLSPRLAMVYSIILQARNRNLSCFQRILTASLSEQIVSTKVYDRLNKVGVTLSYARALSMCKDLGTHYIEEMRALVEQGFSFRLIGDNLNFVKNVAHETKDNHKHMVHMFASAVLASQKHYEDKSDQPTIPLKNLKVADVIPSWAEYDTMMSDFIPIIAPVLVEFLPQLQFLEDAMPKQHRKINTEFCNKTVVVPLPVLPLNEQSYKDTVKILEFYVSILRLLPLPQGETIQIGGDQLTRERFSHAMKLRLGNIVPHERFVQLGEVTFEFFHLMMNFLEKVCYDSLWNSTGEVEMGTLRGEKERMFRHSVDPDVSKAYSSDKEFYIQYVHAHIVVAAQEFFGMENLADWPTTHVPPAFTSQDECKAWVYKTLRVFLDEYCFPHWSGSYRLQSVSHPQVKEVQTLIRKLPCGITIHVPLCQPSVTVEPTPKPDKKKVYGHYVLETGLTFIYLNDLCKTPDRERFLVLMKLMMMQLKGRKSQSKYPLEILLMIFQQLSILPEKRAMQVFHACFVNTRGRPHSNVPADLRMEWMIKENKEHIRSMYSNKTMSNIKTKSSALPSMYNIAKNFDEHAEVVTRSDTHKPKDLHKEIASIIADLQIVKPFTFEPGRSYSSPKFANLQISPAKNLNHTKFTAWFQKHKQQAIDDN